MLYVLRQGSFREYKDIVEVDDTEYSQELVQDIVNQSLERS
jgi:hypothetical protein